MISSHEQLAQEAIQFSISFTKSATASITDANDILIFPFIERLNSMRVTDTNKTISIYSDYLCKIVYALKIQSKAKKS